MTVRPRSSALVEVRLTRDVGLVDQPGPRSLPAPQQERYARLRREEDRADYLAARALARVLVARCVGLHTSRVVLPQLCPGCGSADHGRPRVEIDGRAAAEASVSWSHSDGAVAAAAGLGVEVGVDVERESVLEPPADLLRLVLSEDEQELVDRAPDRGRCFRSLWVRREALVKLGVGSLDEVVGRAVRDVVAPHPSVTVTSWSVPQCRAQVGLAVRDAAAPRGAGSGGTTPRGSAQDGETACR